MFILAISRFVYAMSTAMIGITIFAVRFLQHTFSHSIGDDPAVCLSQPTSMADGRFSKLAFSDSTQRSLHIFHYLTTSVFFMTFLLRSLQLYAASLLFCHLAGAFLLTPPNVVSCFLQHVIWNREAGDPQAIQLLLQDIAQGGLRNIVQSLDPTAEEGTVSVSFSHPGDYEIQCEDNNGTLISSLPLTVPDCTMPGSTSAKTSALESSANIASATGTARSVYSIPSVTAVPTSDLRNSSSRTFPTGTSINSNLSAWFPEPTLSLSLSRLPSINISLPWPSSFLSAFSKPTNSLPRPSITSLSNGNNPVMTTSLSSTIKSAQLSITTSPSSTIKSGLPHSNSTISNTIAVTPSIQADSTTFENSSVISTFSGSKFETLLGGLSPSVHSSYPTTTPSLNSESQDPSQTFTHAALATASQNSQPTLNIGNPETTETGFTETISSTSITSLPPTPFAHPTLQSIPLPTTSGVSSDSNHSIQQTMSQPGAIAGVTIGAVILASVVSLLITCCMLKRRRERRYNDRRFRKLLNPFFEYHAVSSSSGSQSTDRSAATEAVSDPEATPVPEMMEVAGMSSQRGWNWKAQLRKWRSSHGVIEPFITSRTAHGRHTDITENGRRIMEESRRFSDDIQNDFSRIQEERMLLRSSSVVSVATTTTARMSSAMIRSTPSDVEYQINRLHEPRIHHLHYRTQSRADTSSDSRYYPESKNNETSKTGFSSTDSSTDYRTALPSSSPGHPRSPLPSYNSYDSPLAMTSEPPQLRRMSFQSSWAQDPFLSNQEIERLAADEQEADWAMEGFLEPVALDDLPPVYSTSY